MLYELADSQVTFGFIWKYGFLIVDNFTPNTEIYYFTPRNLKNHLQLGIT